MSTADDAGVVRIGPRQALVHTLDVITPIVDEPASFGRIAAANAISDVYAMGALPTSAVRFLALPKEVPARAVTKMLQAAREVFTRARAPRVGGHTVKDKELKFGFAVTGMVDPRRMTTNSKARAKDWLLLTKPLGTGVLFQAMKAEARTAAQTRALVASMSKLNAEAAQAMMDEGVRCATDVTGFGLVGHALNIARGSNVDVILDARSLPALPGVWEHLLAGRRPGTTNANLKGYGRAFVPSKGVSEHAISLAADPQTSGGLLMSAAPAKARRLIERLGAVRVGEIRVRRAQKPAVRMLARLD